MIDQIRSDISQWEFARTEEVLQRIHQCLQDAMRYYNSFGDYFISDFLQGKDREAKSFFLFSASHLIAFPKFFDQDLMQILPLHKQVQFVEIKKKSFDDPMQPTLKSRYLVNATFLQHQSIELKSSGHNCTKAFTIVQKYLIPNLLV
jgi:hypothetical protein